MERILSAKDIISSRYQRTTGKEAWRENLRYAIFAADKVRSTLGPKGAYKMVTYNKGPERVVKVTKDAIAILDELAIQYPPSVIISESAKMQREEAGDGVATFVVFLSTLLKKADELLTRGIHANTIIHGYHLATNRALDIIDQHASSYDEQNSDILDTVDCKRNILTPEIRSMIREAYPLAFAEDRFDPENIRFLKKKGGSLDDSSLIHGVVLKKEKALPNMLDSLNNLRIAIITERLGINRLELKMRGEGPIPIRLNIKTAQQYGEYKETEHRLQTQNLKKLVELKVNVLLCEQPIDDDQKNWLLARGIFALEKVEKKDTQAIAKATGAKTVGKLGELTDEDIGLAEKLQVGKIELEKTVTIQGCNGATFLLKGNTQQAIDELETTIRNSITVLKLVNEDRRILLGGGAAEAQIAQELKQYAKDFSSREQIAIEVFSDALMEIPRCLAENNGLNPTDIMIKLKQHHADGFCNYGINEQGCEDNVCSEPIKIKRSIIRRAFEVSSLMLRIDELLISKEIAKFHKK